MKNLKERNKKIKRMNLDNCLFVFETQEQFHSVWNSLMENTEDSIIQRNTFMVMKNTWLIKLIKFIFRVK